MFLRQAGQPFPPHFPQTALHLKKLHEIVSKYIEKLWKAGTSNGCYHYSGVKDKRLLCLSLQIGQISACMLLHLKEILHS